MISEAAAIEKSQRDDKKRANRRRLEDPRRFVEIRELAAQFIEPVVKKHQQSNRHGQQQHRSVRRKLRAPGQSLITEPRENRLILPQMKRQQKRGGGNQDIRADQSGLDCRNDPFRHAPRRSHSARLQSYFI